MSVDGLIAAAIKQINVSGLRFSDHEQVLARVYAENSPKEKVVP